MSNANASGSSSSLHRTGQPGGAAPQPGAQPINVAASPATPDRRAGTGTTPPAGGSYQGQQQSPNAQSHLASPAPPIVVVSPSQEVPSSEIIQRTSLIPTADPNSARAQNLNRLRNNTPKDTIPMVGKPPRKQRSSRFHVTERVEIERLPSFAG